MFPHHTELGGMMIKQITALKCTVDMQKAI